MIEQHDLHDCMTWLNTRLRSHGGALELVSSSDDGAVEVRFGGMCCGCPYKALTFNGTVAPALRAVAGVSIVTAAGTRISAEAASRLDHYVTSAASGIRYDRHQNTRSLPSSGDDT